MLKGAVSATLPNKAISLLQHAPVMRRFGLLLAVVEIAGGRVNSGAVCHEVLFDLANELPHFHHWCSRVSE